VALRMVVLLQRGEMIPAESSAGACSAREGCTPPRTPGAREPHGYLPLSASIRD